MKLEKSLLTKKQAWTGMAWTAWNRTGVFTRVAVEFLILKTGITSIAPSCKR
jgi:hypothetical protein